MKEQCSPVVPRLVIEDSPSIELDADHLASLSARRDEGVTANRPMLESVSCFIATDGQPVQQAVQPRGGLQTELGLQELPVAGEFAKCLGLVPFGEVHSDQRRPS